MEQRLRLAQIWVVNPTSSHHWTHGIGGSLIHFDVGEILEMKLRSLDVAYLNIVAVMETQGFTVYDLLYHIENSCLGEQGLQLVESNAQLQKIKRHYKEAKVLNLLVGACPPPISQFQKQELSPIVYKELVVYDLSEPLIYVVDQEGVVFESQSSSFSVPYEEEGSVLLDAEQKKKEKLPIRRGPTTRSHSSVLEEEVPNVKPSSNAEDKGFLKEARDDGFEPLSFVLSKKRKSRAKKRPARKWYNEKMEEPSQQLCL
ncbi:hypothetical protein D1007_45132 [Hordeum vulgare]|nr:hypothetical protein D1007_45132 [Hordeum vulgare]